MTPKLMLDLDGVLGDLHSHALRFHGGSIPPLELRWEFPVQLGFTGPYDPKFWEPLDHAFWATVPWTREGRRLVAGMEQVFGGPQNILIVTTPVRWGGSMTGKRAWIEHNLPDYADRLVLTMTPKAELAHPAAVLVDDYGPTVEAFRAAGGRSVLVPRPWNAGLTEVNANGNFDVEVLIQRVAAEADDIRHGHSNNDE